MPSISSWRGAARRRAIRASFALTGLVCSWLLAAILGASPAVAQEASGALLPGASATLGDGAGEGILLREAPGYDAAVLAPLVGGTTVEVLAGPLGAPDGTSWYQVAADQVGYVPAWLLVAAPATAPVPAEPPVATAVAPVPDGETWVGAQPAPGGPATTSSAVNLRSGPSPEADVLLVLPGGSSVGVTGPAVSGFTPVSADGVVGWVSSQLLQDAAQDAAPEPASTEADGPHTDAAAPSPAAVSGLTGGATTTNNVNLRAGPSYGNAVLDVVPAGTVVEATGPLLTGFFPVSYNGQQGWIASDYLAFGAAEGSIEAPTAAVPAPSPAVPGASPAVEAAPAEPAASGFTGGSGLIWPFQGGTWNVIQGYNNGTHTNRSAFAQYQHSLDLAMVDGETAGQPMLAPASGTVEWVDGGSGGILIDMGNGFGAALFHVTVDPGIRGGDQVQQGQRIGVVSGPGGPGYAVTPHVQLTLWQIGGGSNVSAPFVGPFAVSGQEFPDGGGANQYMGAEIAA